MSRVSKHSRRALLSGHLSPTVSSVIASMVVYAHPQRLARVGAKLAALAGVEVAATDTSGKLIVVLESPDEAYLGFLIGRINDTAGVLSANLVYHYSEPPAAEDVIHEHDTP